MAKTNEWDFTRTLFEMTEKEIQRIFGDEYHSVPEIVAGMKMSDAIKKYDEYYGNNGIRVGDYYTDGEKAMVVTYSYNGTIHFLLDTGETGCMPATEFTQKYQYMGMYTNLRETSLASLKSMRSYIKKAS